jgi:hypothetical protein
VDRIDQEGQVSQILIPNWSATSGELAGLALTLSVTTQRTAADRVQLMIDFNVGVSPSQNYEIKRIDPTTLPRIDLQSYIARQEV